MPKLLIIADDLTGALDTGVKFAEAGLSTAVSTRWKDGAVTLDANVAVLCADTRHLSPERAYEAIRGVVEANTARFPLIMKKTDSGLRGNIGAELHGVLDGSGEDLLAFLPALPEMDRVTRGGVQYISGEPVSRSVFGRDPFEPVLEDDISRLLGRQCSVPSRVIPRDVRAELPPAGEKTILIYDAETAEDMRRITAEVLESGRVRMLAGCAGLAQALSSQLASSGRKEECEETWQPLLVVCGSVNRISKAQLDYAEKQGMPRFRLPMEFLMDERPFEGDNEVLDRLLEACRAPGTVLVDTGDSAGSGNGSLTPEELERRRAGISRRLGAMVKALMDRGMDRRILIIGGDTLLELINGLDCTTFSPLDEPAPGVVHSSLPYRGRERHILSKSGGFGEEDLLVKL